MTNEHLHALNIPNKQTNNSSGALVFRTLNFWAKFSRRLSLIPTEKNVGWKSVETKIPRFGANIPIWWVTLVSFFALLLVPWRISQTTRWVVSFTPWIARRGETNPEKKPIFPSTLGGSSKAPKAKKIPNNKQMMTVFYSPKGVGWLVGWLSISEALPTNGRRLGGPTSQQGPTRTDMSCWIATDAGRWCQSSLPNQRSAPGGTRLKVGQLFCFVLAKKLFFWAFQSSCWDFCFSTFFSSCCFMP